MKETVSSSFCIVGPACDFFKGSSERIGTCLVALLSPRNHRKHFPFRGNTRCLQCRSSGCVCVVNTMEHNEPQPPTYHNICRHSYATQKAEKIFWSDTREEISSVVVFASNIFCVSTVPCADMGGKGKCEDAPPEIRSDIRDLGTDFFSCPRKIPTIQGNVRDTCACGYFPPTCRLPDCQHSLLDVPHSYHKRT